MASSTGNPTDTRYSRRLKWLFVGIIVAIVLYTVGWFAFASWLEGQAKRVLADVSRNGTTAECADLSTGGFPFQIGIFCDAVRLADKSQGVSVSAGAFRTAAQIYDPARLIAEIDGPATVAAPSLPPLTATWELLRASTRWSRPLPSRASMEGKALRVVEQGGAAFASADSFEAHMRTRDADMDLAGTFAGLTLAPELTRGRTLPALSGDADLTIANGVAFLASEPQSLRSQSGELRALVLRLGGDAGVTISGPVAIDTDGLIDATLAVTLTNPAALGQVLGDVVPEARDQVQSVLSGFASLANAQGQTPPLPVRIARGQVSIGFIRVGEIPAVN